MRALLAVLASMGLAGCTLVFSQNNARPSSSGSSGGESTGSAWGSSTSAASSGGTGTTEISGSGSGTSSASSASSSGSGSTTSGSTSDSSSSGSSTSGAASGATGGSSTSGSDGGSSGSSGTVPAEPVLILPNGTPTASTVWVSLGHGQLSSGEVVAIVGGRPDALAAAKVDVYGADAALLYSTSTNGCPIIPRAVAIGVGNPPPLALLGQIDVPANAGWAACTATFTAGNALGAFSQDICSAAAECGEAIDIAGAADGYFYAIGTDQSNYAVFDEQSDASWNRVGGEFAEPMYQMRNYPTGGDNVAVMKQWSSGGTELRTYTPANGTAEFQTSYNFTSFDLAGGVANNGEFGGPDGVSTYTGWADLGSWNTYNLNPQAYGLVGGVATNGTYSAWLYVDNSSQLHLHRIAPSPCTLDFELPGALAPVLGAAGDGSLHAGRQIAMTSSDAVFFVTSDGGWYLPHCP